MTMTIVEKQVTRAEQVQALRDRDGDNCQFPDCGRPLDFSLTTDDNPLYTTIDHWIPQHHGKTSGWTTDEIWALSNLKLMHKKCNAKKGDRIPNEDGSIPERAVRKFRYRRDKRAGRPDICVACDNGHGLLVGEICGSCGCDAQRFPRDAKVSYNDCDHEILWCWVCSITPDMRTPAMVSAIRHADVGEWDSDGE